ncbi:DNA-directed RNA polymerase [Pleurotus ostreatus]|nr:DNA-directed RNA polymerase [Pleurotus ostreatus]
MLVRLRTVQRCRLPPIRRFLSNPAFATNPVPHPDYPPFIARVQQTPGTLQGTTRFTVLPTPLPQDSSSPANDVWFTDSTTQELIAVIDACLHNLYDVPRAKQIFDRLRKRSSNVLEPRIYNSMLESYVAMASATDDAAKPKYWLEEAWRLYQTMESSTVDKIAPTASTYALMLLAWLRFNPDSANPVSCDRAQTPLALLSNLIDREISVPSIVSDRVFESDEEAAQVIKMLSKAAVDLNLSKVVSELGQAEAIGSTYQDPLENVPDVRPVLAFKMKDKSGTPADPEIPFNLTNLRNHLADVVLARRVLPSELTARQKLLEESVYDVAVTRLKHQAERFAELGITSQALKTHDLQKWMWEWHLKLQERLAVAIKDILEVESNPVKKRGRVATTIPLSPFLQLVKPEKLSLITILEIMRLQGTGGVSDGMKTARALIGVGQCVEMEYKAQMCKKNTTSLPSSIPTSDIGSNQSTDAAPAVPGAPAAQIFSKYQYWDLHARRVAAKQFVEDGEGWTADWTQAVRLKVGSILVECLMDVAEVERTGVHPKTGAIVSEVQPAFFHSYEYIRGQKLGVIRLNPVVAERIAKDGLRETLHPRHLPMLVRPKPWLNHDQGGYFYNKTSAMRFKDSVEQLAYLKHASQLGNVELVYAGLDVLGSTPWRINRPVFDVVLAVWNSGLRLGKMPPATYDEQEPERPDNYETDLRARNSYLQRQRAYAQGKANNHSDRCSVNYKIEIARAFLGDTIYLPHNLDFRGRAYPIPPHLNHIGDDLSRGLLKFSEAKPLGERGLRWLKIHLANLYGFDKASFDERVEFVMDRLDDVFDSATRPLEGRRWWTQADDPWQCLACCIELHAALTSPDPPAFMSSIPVHQDGTCNGLQHYAALGGDARGAAQVNLSASERPSDVYTYVGNMVEKLLEEDAQKGEKYAILLQGKITRKVVKQTVMTTVYGVTYVGARDQIEKQLKDRKDIPDEDTWGASAYLAKKVLACIGDLFTGAQHIQNWLNLCARLISKSIPADRLPEVLTDHSKSKGGSRKSTLPQDRIRKEQMTSVVWTTPLGLPIVQPYRKPKRKQIMTSLQTVFISDPNSPAEVNTMKQASAFPPNFIHSLDATHMMLTALECRAQGLTFASVHDSYWTHACSIDKMSEVIRDTFITLHSSDVLVKLQEEFLERYRGYKVPLMNLRSPRLVKHLKEAGARVVATPEQAKTLDAIKELLVISDTEKPTVEETDDPAALADLQNMLEQLQKEEPTPVATPEKSDDPSKSLVEMLLEEDESEVDEEEEDEQFSPRAKAAKKRKAKEDAATITLLGKFVDLTDILPPLPAKGDFKVEAIKSSQYFFS